MKVRFLIDYTIAKQLFKKGLLPYNPCPYYPSCP